MNYSIQFERPRARKVHMTVELRAKAWALLVSEFLAAHPGRIESSVTVLEVTLWKAGRR